MKSQSAEFKSVEGTKLEGFDKMAASSRGERSVNLFADLTWQVGFGFVSRF